MASVILRSVPQKLRINKNVAGLFIRMSSTSHGTDVDPLKGKIAARKGDGKCFLNNCKDIGYCLPSDSHQLSYDISKTFLNEQGMRTFVNLENCNYGEFIVWDPFEMNVKKRATGTKEEPTLIPSLYDKRLIGCVCEDDSLSIIWMFLHRGEPKRCQCGYWFKLVDIDKSKFVEP